MNARLRIECPEKSPYTYPIENRSVFMVGRENSNTLVLQDPHVSRKHFYIRKSGNDFHLVNLSKSQGTLLNGQAVENTIIKAGDEIRAGETRILFELEESQGSSVSPQRDPSQNTQPLPASPLLPRGETRFGQTLILASEEETEGETPFLAKKEAGHETMLAGLETDMAEDLRKRFRLLQDLARQLTGQLNLNKLLDFILDRIFEIVPADNGLILLLDEKKQLETKAVRLEGKEAREKGKLPISNTLIAMSTREKVGILSANTARDSRLSDSESIISFGMKSVLCVPLVFEEEVLGVLHLDTERPDRTFQQDDLELLTILANQAALFIKNSTLHQQMVREEMHRANLERFFSPQIAEKIARNEVELDTGGKSVEAIVLFSDIRGFTSLCERTSPGDVVRFLNTYFTAMVDIVFEYGGTLDKYVGDALVAVFGTPLPSENDTLQAARCAEMMLRRLEEMTFEVGPVKVGIGLHVGPLIHGNIGSEKMLQFTCIGDTVNTAARLCSAAGENQIVISQALKDRLENQARTAELGPMQLKGKKKPLETFELLQCL